MLYRPLYREVLGISLLSNTLEIELNGSSFMQKSRLRSDWSCHYAGQFTVENLSISPKSASLVSITCALRATRFNCHVIMNLSFSQKMAINASMFDITLSVEILTFLAREATITLVIANVDTR